MLADVYGQTSGRNEAGQVLREWDDTNAVSVANMTEGILGGGIRVVGSTETWSEDYEEVEWAKMYISNNKVKDDNGNEVIITKRFRVKNIRDGETGKQLWVGDDGEPIEFKVLGVTPIMDPFGAQVEFELLLKGVTGD